MQENTVCAANCTVQEKRGGQKIMLIRNATLQMSATERACMDVRVMNGCVWEMGVALVKGLYESEIDLHGDVLMPGRMLETPVPAADKKTLRLLCRRLYREGVRYFVADCPADALLRVQNRPERRGALPVTALPNPEPLRSGTGMPLTRWTAAGEFVGMMDEHSGD